MKHDLALVPTIRQSDKYGSGWYHAPRGTRKHNGIDPIAMPGAGVICPVEGVVTKLGYPYADDLSYRYVQITDANHYDWRFFYVSPGVAVDEIIPSGSVIGVVQDIANRYPDITPHFHLEIKNPMGEFVNPDKLINV